MASPSPSDWSTKLWACEGATFEEKAAANVIILSKPESDRRFYVPGSPEGVAASIKALISNGAAAGLGLGSPAGVETFVARVREGVTEDVCVLLERVLLGPRRKPMSFSSVGTSEAGQLLGELGILEVRGTALAQTELEVPAGTVPCTVFDFTPYHSEDAGTPFLLMHHQRQLEALGVVFGGRGGFEVHDLHTCTSDALLVRIGGKAYRGICDGCIAPYGLAASSALRQCRVIYEHKKPRAVKGKKGKGHKGQAIMELLAAYAYGPCPVLLDLTDGTKHDLYTIRGKQLFVWAGLEPTQAYCMQARHLQSDPMRADLELKLDQIPEEEQTWMRPLHQQLRPVSALQEQLESVIPFVAPEERAGTALELIHAWAQAQPEPLPLPPSIQAFYS